MFSRRKPDFVLSFVETQGFEKQFFVKNFKRYFGDDVRWGDSVDADTGKEGLQIYSTLQDHIKRILIARMRKDSMKEYHHFLNRRHEREGTEFVDRSPHIATARSPHLGLPPALDDVFTESNRRTESSLRPSTHRQCRSTPASPTTQFASISTYSPEPARATIMHFEGERTWGPAVFYDESKLDIPHHIIPELRISHAPSVIRPLKISKSTGNFDANFAAYQPTEEPLPTRRPRTLVPSELGLGPLFTWTQSMAQ